MKKFVVYNGGTESNLLVCTTPSVLEKGKRYEVVGQTYYAEDNAYTLKHIGGYFDAKWFDECETVKEKSKSSYLAKVNIYSNDMSSYVGVRMKIDYLDGNEVKTKMTTPVESISSIYDSIYRIETEDSVYITEVNKRTVV